MIIDFNRPKPSMPIDFDTDTSYLSEDDAFAVNDHLHEWPAARNPFVDRMAKQLKPGFHGCLAVHDFMSLVAGAVTQQPDSVFDFRVTVGFDAKNVAQMRFEVIRIEHAGLVPMTADNPGFFSYAMHWMGRHRPTFELGVCGNEFFWVHVARD